MMNKPTCDVLACNRPKGETGIPISQIFEFSNLATLRGTTSQGAPFLCCDACAKRFKPETKITFERL